MNMDEVDADGWVPVVSGGDDLLDMLGIEIIAKKVIRVEKFAVKFDNRVEKMTQGELWRFISEKCEKNNFTTDHVLTTLLCKYYS